MHAHLTHLSEPSVTLQGLTEQAAFFLLSICIRSAEGRKRIVNEIVHTLSPSDKAENKSDEQAVVRRAVSNPYKVQPGFPAPHKVHTHLHTSWIDLSRPVHHAHAWVLSILTPQAACTPSPFPCACVPSVQMPSQKMLLQRLHEICVH